MTKVTQAHIDARMGDILGAALRVFARRGTDAATMQEIAAEASLSAGAIYRYFTNKEDLVRAVFENAIAENRRMFEEAASGASSPFEALVRAGYGALDDAEASGGCIDLDLSIAAMRDEAQLRPVYREMHAEVTAMVAGLVRSAQSSGEIGKELDADLLGRVLVALVNGLRLEMLDPETAPNGRAAIDLVATILGCTAKAERVRTA